MNRLKKILEILDRDYPEWKKARETFQNDYLKHDARREIFVSFLEISRNAQLCYFLMETQLCEPTWWKNRYGRFTDTMATDALTAYAVMVNLFTVHGLDSTVEETLRAIVRTKQPPFTMDPRKEFQSLFQHVLSKSGLATLEPLFHILRLTRNSVHNNGVHDPPSGRSESWTYKGKQFDFIVGKEISFINGDFLAWLTTELSDGMMQIVICPAVGVISYCPRRL